MKIRTHASGDALLRQRAVEQLQERQQQTTTDPADALKLLHELQVHQIELEMQNEALIASNAKADELYANLYEFAPVCYLNLDAQGLIKNVNIATTQLLDVERSNLIGRHFSSYILAEDLPNFNSAFRNVFQNKQGNETCDLALTAKDGSLSYVYFEARFENEGEFCRAMMLDITERKNNEAALELAASVHQAIGQAVMIANMNNRIISVNPAFTKITGYSQEEAVGQLTTLLKSNHQSAQFYQSMWQFLNSGGRWRGEIVNRRKNGEEYPEWLEIYTVYDRRGEPLRRVGLFSDITDQKHAEQVLWNQLNYDSLTGLPNRRLFQDRLAQELKKAERSKMVVALFFIDLDQFKEVNDTLGHSAGDILLREVGTRIAGCMRDSDTVARLGGDEFVVILPNWDNAIRIDLLAQNIIEVLQLPFQLGAANNSATNGKSTYITASIGITLYPNDGSTVEELLKHADQAMYLSKEDGRNRYSFYTHELQVAAVKRSQMIDDLRSALVNNEFRVYYQPIVELTSGRTFKAEALIRWQHPQQGLINPAEFIPLAEETGLIIAIGDLVFQTAAQQAKLWRNALDPKFQISVNKSPVQFHRDEDKHALPWLGYLKQLEMPTDGICIEITEGLLLDKSINVSDKLLGFRNAGLQVSLDDFGTGYSSLAYLKKFHIDYIKIDQSFVSHLESDKNDIALCEAIIVMAHKLGIKVIAEGVETEYQRNFLKQAGCDYAQGYLFSKPVPAEELEKLLRK